MIELVLNNTWQNLRTLAGFSPEQEFLLYNKSSDYVHITNTISAPTDERDGFLVLPFNTISVQSGTNPIWVIGSGPIAVIEAGRLGGFNALPSDLYTNNVPGIRRVQVDAGEAAYFEGRQYRISYEYIVTATPLVIRFSCPRGFTIYHQDIECDQGGVGLRAWRSAQGTPSGTFNTPITQWAVKGNAETPVFVNPVTIFTGGGFTPTGGQTAAETLRVLSNTSGSGPSSNRGSVGSVVQGERGLPAGDYYLILSRLPGITVDAVGVLDLVYAADRD